MWHKPYSWDILFTLQSYIEWEQVFRVQSGNVKGAILPITSQCTIKMVLKLLFSGKKIASEK